MKLFLTSMILFSLLAACQTAEVKRSGPPPDWVVRTPLKSGMICAVGTSGPTYYRDDAQALAAENARAELARTINVSIKNIMVEMTTEKGSYFDDATVSEVSSWATSAVVENSSILEYWHDADGQVLKKDFTYALGCMPRKFDRKSLQAHMTDANISDKKNFSEISRAADEIIKQLEEME
ncbi:MAG: hypothetical protein AB1499_10310 [Nitrospirota bacterium]